ncbi:MAG TPA: type IV toxin-antitoxin system AbiEi family antitoxin domain-containing protein [Nocardioides sp.]|nr:type IV toxin-antitoxin system AbiEi family antitoxin domain-containing protein [Nocardioides sp.]
MDELEISELMTRQHGVIARRQVLDTGGSDVDIERRVRRREWAQVHPGVYVSHTGPLTPFQTGWAAVLRCWPAALAGSSALQAHGMRTGREDGGRVEVVVDETRRVTGGPGIRVTRLTSFVDLAQMHLVPPRVRLEHAVLTVASRAPTEDAAVAVIADACQVRRTTARLLLAALATMPRLRRRHLLAEVLEDAAVGAWSALERRYLVHVERAHGLPHAQRQRVVRPGRTVAHRDVDYLDLRVVVELDGRLGHEWNADRWRDLDRDIDAAVAGDLTVRAGWRQVLDPCRLAAAVARLLLARGWTDLPRGCQPGCPVAIIGGSPAPRAGDPATS